MPSLFGYCSRECQVSHRSLLLSTQQAAIIAEGIVATDEIDYRVLDACFAVDTPYKDQDFNGLPSMETFYENFGRVARGEWWFYQEIEQEIEDAEADYQRAPLSPEDRIHCFMFLCVFLCYDYFKFSAEPKFTEDSFVMRTKDEFGGVTMPAASFLQTYKNGRRSQDPTDRLRLRRETRTWSTQNFIQSFHK